MRTVHSVAPYGSPIWARRLAKDKKSFRQMRQAQRDSVLRLARTYRTVSHAADTVLAGTPPIDLLAAGYAQVYRQLKARGIVRTAGTVEPIRQEVRRWVVEHWKTRLHESGIAGSWTIEAIRSCLEEWLGRVHGGLSFRLVQVLTGHGSFGIGHKY
ncbi:uncharacterized protein LOC105426594 [Pogonomyrmex barbatus]|uniref:Uncharacterized protein LOC105426594 n=1 Tax=Pogonomyrmex barbatus TaxID=144034 RepID=A0A6I9WW88_9HYME|nr:uncharacterized protein LOC105426594 [Pogonomyrmex barbatus]